MEKYCCEKGALCCGGSSCRVLTKPEAWPRTSIILWKCVGMQATSLPRSCYRYSVTTAIGRCHPLPITTTGSCRHMHSRGDHHLSISPNICALSHSLKPHMSLLDVGALNSLAAGWAGHVPSTSPWAEKGHQPTDFTPFSTPLSRPSTRWLTNEW